MHPVILGNMMANSAFSGTWFQDLFTGSGALADHTPDIVDGVAGAGTPWSGATWTVNGAAINDPGVTTDYSSDFSADADGFAGEPGDASADGNIDGIAGQDDCLRYTIGTAAGAHYLNRTINKMTIGAQYKLSYSYYIPSTNSHIDRLTLMDSYSAQPLDTQQTTIDTWVDRSVINDGLYNLGIGFRFFDGVSSSFQDAAGDDVVYFKGIKIEPVTLSQQLEPIDLSITEGTFEVDVTIPAAENGGAGIVLCYDVDNYVRVFGRSNGYIRVVKIVAGSPTVLINLTAGSFAAGATLKAEVGYITATDDVTISVYRDDVLIGAEQTITDDAIAGNTYHGLDSSDSADSLNNFTVTV